jgi:hypothetical protein
MGDIYIVTARAKDRTGREDESTGAVPLGNLKGDALANALMNAETKSKRRVTLSIAGLGWLDETELETIPQARQSIATSADLNGNTSGDDVVTASATTVANSLSLERHPTADDITTLVDTARAANVSLEDFGADMRQQALRRRLVVHGLDAGHRRRDVAEHLAGARIARLAVDQHRALGRPVVGHILVPGVLGGR